MVGEQITDVLTEVNFEVVEFCVEALGVDSSTAKMTAHVVPLICSPLRHQTI